MVDLFISYASEERERIRPFIEALEERGLSVWWDREIHLGSSWDEAIEHALEEARWIVPIWTT